MKHGYIYQALALVLLLSQGCVMYTDNPGPLEEPYSEAPYPYDERISYEEEGVASFMADEMQKKKTASGIEFDLRKLVAAHPNLPFGTVVKVTNLSNNKSVTVTIIDVGPFVKGRIIDVSFEAAKQLGFVEEGSTQVRVNVVRLGDGTVNPEAL
ncbi:septal ring lytic transglycosylase RlpA family protein [candidate division KSB1 bacterium]|nr:septal ring lytic transglycosylase RlpA family protein [candidate division KSB1 bacterium]RQW10733.1 MAG: septal ring lytic transglycosylase RlpA family protein [candidate division KSB1 bacterium]